MPKIEGFILAAGLGTRMGPLSRVLPKPAWTLNGRSLLDLSAQSLRDAGLSRLAANVHHLPERLAEVAGDLELCLEPTLLGSAGGLSHVRDRAADPLAVWNADALGAVPWTTFLAEHRAGGVDLSWLLVPHPGGPWNAVYRDAQGQVLPVGETSPDGPYHFTGAALWGPAALALLDGSVQDTKRDILPRVGRPRGVVVPPFPWIEVGSPDQLLEAAAQLAPQAEGRIPGSYLHPSARLGPGVTLSRCILGPGVRLDWDDEGAFWSLEEGRLVRRPLP